MAVIENSTERRGVWLWRNDTDEPIDLFITMTGPVGEDSKSYDANEGSISYYKELGATPVRIEYDSPDGKHSFHANIAGGRGSLKTRRAYGEWRGQDRWERRGYWKNDWDRFWGKRSYRNEKVESRWWWWGKVENQNKQTQQGQTMSFILTILAFGRIKVFCTNNQPSQQTLSL
ncbi:hypothetical protein [Helicobacter felis]|uniref:hypothetical protein n=1 Tax=Helicobacter felis TaxID=214 RepID=UPI000CF05630|nr:hypothetical protein [Helicobacter felis]